MSMTDSKDAVCVALRKEIEEAQESIAACLLEIDDIELQINPQIEAEYATKIGYLENELLKWQLAARRAKRRVALAQARINAGHNIDVDQLEDILDEELALWEQKLAESMQGFLQLMERKGGTRPLSPEESKELTRLHRMLIKRLHPDLHPGATEEQQRFFHVAQSAFERGDLVTLRAIEVSTADMDVQIDIDDLSADEIYAELELIQTQKRIVEERLYLLKSSHPYVLKEKLEDGAWVLQRVGELNEHIELQKSAKRAYDERFSQLTEGEAKI